MPTFQAIPDDEQRMATYILQSVPAMLKAELDEYISYRTATFAAKRQGGAVQSISAEADKTALLRFLGYLDKTNLHWCWPLGGGGRTRAHLSVLFCLLLHDRTRTAS